MSDVREIPESWLHRAPAFSIGQLPVEAKRAVTKIPDIFLTEDAHQGVVAMLVWRLPDDLAVSRTYVLVKDGRVNQVVQSRVQRFESWELIRFVLDHGYVSVPFMTATQFIRDLMSPQFGLEVWA